jgi:oxalate decarboxylase/phosphoglucose isomerase-like protein (cupin superfamily)
MPNAHYSENTDNVPPVFLEVLQAPTFSHISVGQWLGLTAPQIVKDHLNVDDAFVSKLLKTKQIIMPGDKNLTRTDFSSEPL